MQNNRLNSWWSYRALTVTLFLPVCSFLSAQAPAYLSLDEAISIALQRNYQVIIDSNNVLAAAINNSPGNAGFLPQVNLNGSVTYSGQNIKQEFSNGTEINRNNVTSNVQNAGISATWTLFDGGRMFATARLLRLQEDQARTISKDDLQILMANTINAWYNVVQQKQLLNLVDSSLKYYDIQLAVTENLRLNGKGTRQQVLQAQIDRNNELAHRYGQLNALLDAKTNLNLLLQRRPDLDFEVADTILILPAFSADTTEQFIRQHNSMIIAANRNVDIQTAMLLQTKSLFLPQLSLNAGYGFNNSTSSASFFLLNQNLGWNAGLTLSYNLFDGFKTRSLVDISQINVDNARLQYKQVLSETQAALSNAYHKYKAAMQQMILLRQNLELANENLQIALEQYKLYAITQIELQRAHKSYDDAGAAYIAAAYTVKTAETNLLLLSGALVQ